MTAKHSRIPLIAYYRTGFRSGQGIGGATYRLGTLPPAAFFAAIGTGAHRGIFERRGPKRLPIEQLLGPGINEVVAKRLIFEALRTVVGRRVRDAARARDEPRAHRAATRRGRVMGHEPASLRVVMIVAEWLAEDPALPADVPIDVRDFSNDIAPGGKPALFVVLGNTAAELRRESDLGVVEPLGIEIVGYVRAETEDGTGAPIAPAVTATRERLLQAVRRRLAEIMPGGDSLVERLRQDRAAVGSGAESFEEWAPAGRGESGQTPPWGDFRLFCTSRLHYHEGEF